MAKAQLSTALEKPIDRFMSCIDKDDMVGTLFQSFAKAFDLVDHTVLIRKLSIINSVIPP